MKKISIRSLFSIFGLACLSLVFAFISCEIGLGSAVDTQAPVVNFAETTIGSGGVIRDSFMIYGDWTDDGSIKEVTAKLTRTDGTKISFENAGTVVTLEAGKGTWNAVFDPIKEKIPDGSYEISVSMLDNGKHISTITRAIVIDNTAPLVVLSRPSTKKDSGKFDSYGQSFTLEGKAADDNDVSLIEVNVYADESCTGTPLKTIQLPNVPLTIEQDVAVYDKTKANDYSIIYGHVDAEGIAIKDGTTSQRYCTLVVYDGAQRYPSDGSEQTEADKKGNSVNYYYLNSDVSKLFTAGYKITELYHILNGSYEQGTASRSISSSDVNTLLADPSKQTTCGQFSLNPENSPSYVVSSRNVLPEGHKFDEYPITNGNSQLEVEIAPGLDGHLIVEDTVGIYLVRCDLTGNPLTTNGTPAASEAEAKKVWLVETDKHEEQAIVTQSGSTYKFKTKKNIGNDDTSGYPQLVIGENYYIAVVGKDEQGNDIVCDGLYGFQLITSGKNIEVGIKAEPEWLSTEDAANEENKKVKITLTYQTENKPFEIYRKFGQDITSTDTPITTGVNDSPYEDNIPAADLTSEPGFVNYKVKGKESAESNQKTIELKYDNDVPATPTFTSVPSVTATEQDDITFQGTAEDTASGSGIEKVWIQFEYKDSTGATKTTTAKEVDASYSGKKWIYQTSQKTDAKVKAAFATQGSKKIIVTAEDVVGLTKSSSQTFTYDTGKPTVSVTEGLPSIVGQVQTLSGTAGDTWGVKKIVITQTKKGSTDSISYKYWEEGENASTPTTSKAWTVSIPLKSTTESYTAIDSTSSGEYTYTVTVTDKAEKTTTSDSVTVKFTSAKPTITFTQPSGALALTNSASTTPWQTTSNNITISGTASVSAAVSGASISKVEYKFDNDAAWTSAGQASWSITKTINDGSTEHNLYVKATDNAGNVSDEYHKVIKVDTSAPNLTAKYLKQDTGALKDASGTVYVKSGTKIYLYGNYDDEHSGVKDLTFKLGGNSNTITPTNLNYSTTAITSTTLPTNYSAYSATSSTTYKSWQAEFTFTSSGTLTVQGKNNANKETTTLSVVNVVYDNAAPVVKISSPAKNEKLKAAGLTISGTANDGTGSGLSSGTSDIIVYYTKLSSLGGVTTAPTSISSSTNHGDASSKWVKLGTTASDTNWSFTLSSVNDTITPDGANTALYFTASAKDIAGAGNVGYAVPVTVIVDRKKPVYDSSALTIGGKTHSEMTASTKPWFSTDTLVVKGKYTDDGKTGSGVNTIIYKLDSNSEVELPTTDGTFNTNISGFTANSTLKIKAKDKAGNETDWTTYTVQADTSTTTLTVDTYKAGNDSEQTAAGTVYVKSGTQITLTGQYKNTVSGVKPLEFKLGDTSLDVKYSTNGTSFADYNNSSAKTYTKWQATFTPSAGGTITVNGSNYAEVPVTASSFQLTVDGEDPTLENLKLKETTGSGDDAVTKEAYLNETTETYYINNTVTTKSFKLTGVTTDDYGVEKVSFTVVNTADSNKKLTISDISKPSGAWEKDITGWSSWNDGATLTITATDKAGRSTPKTINIVFDTTAPKAMHWADNKNKDVYFRIGNADNDKNDAGTAWETGDALNDANNAANQDVGSKYSFGSWGNDSSIEIRGAFYEATAGSGIKTIHYAIFDDESKVAAGTTALVAGTLKENTENHVIKVGSFSVQNEVTKRVPYTNTSGTKEGKPVKTNFRETLAGFDASNNFLVLVAEDNAGNREPDTLAVYEGTGTPGSNSWNSLKAYYSIKKDSQTPNITTTTPNLYTNGEGNALSITGTASDALSHLASVTVTVEEIHFEQVIKNFADGSASQNWTATISADKFAGINSGSYTVYAEAKDKAGAGNKKKISAGTIYVDKDAPVVTISSPVADSVTKKTFTISGTARDGNGAGIDETKDLVLYYTKKPNPAAITSSTTFGSSSEADTKWVAYSTKPTLDSTNHQDWTCEVDFSSIAADNNNTDVYLSVSATDKSGSGNTGYSVPRKVTVDRKKPVKSSFNIGSTAEDDIADAWFNNTTLNINGAFVDNGGSGVTEILYTLDSGSEISIPAGENGTFDSNIAGFTNGVHTLKVRAKDAADNESAYSSVTTYTIHVDNQASTLNCTTSGQQYTNGVNEITVSGTFVDSPATDCAGADAITLSVNNKTINATLTLTTQNDYSSGTWTATITTSSLGLVQGTTYSVNGTITDKAGNSSTATVFTLNIDTTAPTVSITTPEVNSKINGTISLSGTVNYEGSIPSKLELYALTSKPTNKNFMNGSGNNPPSALIATKTDATQIYSWTFDNIDVKTKAGVTVSAPEKPIYFVLAVYDTAGNCNVYNTSGTATLTEGTNFFKYTVDQNLDRPVIKFTNLDDASSWVKSSVLKGSITDDDGIKTFKIKEGSNSAETVVVTNGSWEYTFKSLDGENISLEFTVQDNDNTSFTTANSDMFHRPYFLYADNSDNNYQSAHSYTDYGYDNSAALSLKKDTQEPRLLDAGTSMNADKTKLATVASVKADTTNQYEIKASNFSGGNKKYLKFYVPVNDANLEEVTLAIADSSTGVVEKLYTTVKLTENQTDKNDFNDDGILKLKPTNTKKTSDSVEYTYYESDIIDVSGVTDSGLKSVSFDVKDKAGNVTSKSYTFYVDNTGPEVPTITSPSKDDEITGTTTITGTASDSGIGIESIEWLVPPAGTTASTTDAALLALNGWKNSNNNGTASVFKFKFQTNTDCDLVNYDDTTNYAVTHDSTSGLYIIPVYFKITDRLGNYTIYRDYYITHNPDGDRPKTEINYPTEVDYDTNSSGTSLNYVTLGGTIRVSGTVEIPSGTVEVGKVYIQIGTVSGAAQNPSVTWSKTNASLTNEFAALGGTVGKTDLASIYGAESLVYVSNDWWGIPAITKTATWNISLNTTNKLDPGSTGTTNIAIRACAINADGKMGNWSEVSYIHVDKNAPSQNAIIRQYNSSFTPADATNAAGNTALESNVTVNKDYASEMFLKGKWYLVVTLNDNDSLAESSIKVKQGSADCTYYKSTTTGTGAKTKKLYIPVDTTNMTTSSVSYSVYVEDSSGYSSTGTYNFKIDNTAPVLSEIAGNGDDLDTNAENTVKERDYVYTISGKLDDSGSGYERVLFYFVRNGKIYGTTTDYGTAAVLDPLVTSNAKVPISELSALSVGGTGIPKLYAKQATGSAITAGANAGTYTFTDTSSAVSGNNHIHKGALIYIDGEYGKITAVSGATVTFKMDANPVGKTTVYFPYAASVDNLSTEEVSSTTANPFTFSNSSDDGDLMPESITNVSTTWTWKGTIHSSNIPDGPASLVVLAFDAAGNVSGNTYPVDVKNNTPRLAKLFLGTDLNSSGSISADEFSEYSSSITGTNDTAVTIATAGSTAGQFTAKDKLAVKPEIIGGNGTIKMIYKRGATTTTPVAKSDSLALVAYDSGSKTSGTNTNGWFYTYTLSSDAVWQGLTADPANSVGVSFTFWDETEERTQGTNSQNCVAYISDLIIDLEDAEAPVAKIYPFYWTDKTDNSLYENKASNGHIDLEGTNDNGSTVPWVSGKIKIKGTAYDNKMLHTIALKATGFSFNGGTVGNALTFATYNGSEWTLTKGSGTSQTAGGSITEDGWKFELDQNSEVLDQTGHTINWTLYLDTEKVAGGALNNVAVEAILTDWASKTKATADKTSAPSTTQTVKDSETPYYKMNVVPYVVGIKTNLSSLKKTNSSVFDRTALGHYTTNASSPIYLYGFNLAGGTLYDSSTTAKTAALTAKTVAATADYPWYTTASSGATENFFKNTANTTVYQASVSTFKSGPVYVKVGNVNSTNNTNNNDSKGDYEQSVNLTNNPSGDSTIYSNYYNRQPNGDSNNLLTDDLVLDVWLINSSAAPTISGRVDQPIMKINPATGQLNFAYANGPLYFTMGSRLYGGDSTSYDYWMGSYDFFTSIGYTVDKLGYGYGVAAGGDINANSTDNFIFATGRWGVGGRGQRGSYDGAASLRLEQIAQVVNGTNIFNKNRILSPSLATAVHGTTTDLYLVYYDDINQQIRVRKGALDSVQNQNSTGKKDFGTFIDRYTEHQNNGNAPVQNYDYNKNDYTIIAGGNTGYTSGEYVSLAVKSAEGNTTDDVLVVIWYDSTNKVLYYTYHEDPLNMTTGASGYTGTKKFVTPTPVFTETGIGEYCKIAVDKNGGIHVAAYDSSNADVKYAYRSGYNTGSWSEYTVDSNGILGSELTLDVAYNSANGNAVPYIGYYASSAVRPKVAYLAKPAALASGCDSDLFTGVWEVSYVPTDSSVPEDHINVGVWKNNGVITNSNTSTKQFRNATEATPTSNTVINAGQNGTLNGYSSTQWGYVFGNGTANPVLGYQVKKGTSGNIETAQMQ